ncbi:MAG: hypothetical protein M3306_08830 [Actinomycetota bacterium]|nr:hypothetical protein [Actinomycetota bacterium]
MRPPDEVGGVTAVGGNHGDVLQADPPKGALTPQVLGPLLARQVQGTVVLRNHTSLQVEDIRCSDVPAIEVEDRAVADHPRDPHPHLEGESQIGLRRRPHILIGK